LEIGKLFLESDAEFAVDTVPSAIVALEHIKSVHFDAIVSDYQMPKMDGITFLKTLRAQGDTVPFIIFTGKGREEVVIEALNSGADFYLQKGGDPTAQFAELAHKIHHAIAKREADLALQKSERDYRHLIEHAGQAIYVVQDGLLRLVNPRGLELAGYPEEELLNQQFTRFVHPDDRALLRDRFRKRMAGEDVPSRYPFRVQRKDGTVRWVELNVVAIAWDGNPAILNFLSDITEQKLAEDALKESEERYRQFFRTTLVGVFITTRDGRWIDFNHTVLAMFGCTSREEVFRMPIASCYVDPGERQVLVELVEREGYVEEYPVSFRKRDGTVFDSVMTVVPRRNPDGSTREFIGTLRDITERKRTEDALRESEERYRQFFRTTLDSMFITTPEGRFIDVNDALLKMHGHRSYEEMLGVDVASTWAHPEERDAFLETVKQDGVVKEYPIQFKRQDGSVIDTLLTIATQKNPDGSIRAFIGTVRDITEMKHAEQALRESEERYRHIFESFEDLYYQTDDDGIITILSPSLNRLTGWTVDELAGQPITKIYVNPGDRKALLEEIARTGHVRDYEVLLLKRDGTKTPASVSANRIRHADGTPAGIAGTIRDITRRKRAEDALRESEAKFRSLVENALEGILILDPQGNIRFANRAAAGTVGVDDPLSLVGRNVMDFIAPVSRNEVMRDLEQVAAGHDGYPAFYRVVTARGDTIDVECIGKLILFDGQPTDLISFRRTRNDRKILPVPPGDDAR
jgi:PAS domain S-box-containing protein